MAAGGEIASAFVRIRPNLSGFRAQATAGVKEGLAGVQTEVQAASRASVGSANEIASANRRAAASFRSIDAGAKAAAGGVETLRSSALSLGKVIGIAFGVDIAGQFVKGIAEHAADMQKQIEVVKAQFGAAADTILQFGQKSGTALGISSHAADTAAARMGILFHNLGVGKQTAATATVDLLKLAGSISAIRGIDPGIALRNLPLAIAGNLRSLKQLGIATDQNQLKVAAFKLGLTQTISQALTPAQRALAIVAVATAHLGDFQAQAAAHAGDLANRSRALAASWDNAKDALGQGLLPVLDRLVTWLTNKLPGAVEGAKTDVHKLVSAFNDLRASIGPVTGAFDSFLKAIGGVKAAVEALIVAFAVGKVIAFANAIRGVLVAQGLRELRLATEADKIAYIEAFGTMEIATIGLAATIKSALITTGIGAIAVAVGIAVEEVINHWDTVKRYTIALADGIAAIWNGLKKTLIGIAEIIGGTMAASLTLPFRALLEAASAVSGFLGHFGIHIGGGAQKALDALKSVTTGLVTQGVADVTAGGAQMADAFTNAWTAALTKNKASLIATTSGVFAGVGQSASIVLANAAGVDTSPGQTGTSTTAVVDNTIANARQKLSDLRAQLSALVTQNRIDIQNTITEAKANLIQIGTSLADQIGQVIDRPFQVAQQKIQDAQDRLALIYDTKNASLQGEANRLSRLQSQLQVLQDRRNLNQLRNEVSLPGGRRLSTDPKQAVAELNQLARGANQINRPAIDDFILQYRQALITSAQGRLSIKQQGIDARRQAAETKLGLKTDSLTVAQDVANHLKDVTTRDINDLTEKLASGAIKIKAFNRGLAAILAKDHVSYKNAGELLGTAFASGFRASVRGILLQAGAITAGPQLPGTGQEPKIVRPEVTLQKEQLHVTKLQHSIARASFDLQKKERVAADKAAKLLEAIHSTQLGPTATALGKNPGHSAKAATTLTGTS